MKFNLLTIFPSFFDSFLSESLIKKGIDAGIISVEVADIRQYASDKHHKVDDEPYGGGAGMVMKPQPAIDAIRAAKGGKPARTIYLSPSGKPFTQQDAARLAKEPRLILLCGRYEGVDQRVIDAEVDEEISIGDFVMNGGEVPAMAVMEAVFRLLPGSIGKAESAENDSFSDGLLEHPHYTRPEVYEGAKVPGVLLSGNHKKIEQWRYEMSFEKTLRGRADMVANLAEEKRAAVKFSMALVHNPVLGKTGLPMVGSVTTLDVHDFARIGKTYSAEKVYVITPVQDQQLVIERIIGHWTGAKELQKLDGRRTDALNIISVVDSISHMIKDAKRRSKKVKLMVTSAIRSEKTVSADGWLATVQEDEEWIVLFGTAYGLAPEVMDMADVVLEPINGRGEFNHLPVRGASAIITDLLFGTRRNKKND